MPKGVGLKFTRVMENTRLEYRRQTLEGIHVRDIELSAGPESMKTLKEGVATLFASRDVSGSGLEDNENGSGIPQGEKSTEGPKAVAGTVGAQPPAELSKMQTR